MYCEVYQQAYEKAAKVNHDNARHMASEIFGQVARDLRSELISQLREVENMEREITMLKNQIEEAKSVTRQVVKIKADASYGPTKAGDLLTTSATEGHVMKAQPVDVGGVEIYRPGTIIGKALEPLESGTGLIEVFVTLQ